jgi:release factor glutamine methyltransferase
VSDEVSRLRAAGCVFAEEEAALLKAAATTPEDLSALVSRRVAGEPLEQILGWAEFLGRRIALRPGVFVPRRRTQFLAEQAIAVSPPGSVAVDLCCGSGAIATALAAAGRGLDVYAADIDPVAVACAAANVGADRVFRGDLFTALPDRIRGRVGTVVANVPYVPTAEIARMPPEARDHEPRTALDGGADGLDVLRRVAAAAPDWLAPGGHLLVEISQHQVAAAVAAFTGHGLTARLERDDELEATVVIGAANQLGPTG